MFRTRAVPAVALVLAVAAIGATERFQHQESDARDSELDLQAIKLQLSVLQEAPFQADASTGGSPERARRLINQGKAGIGDRLERLDRGSPPAAQLGLEAALTENVIKLDLIYTLGTSRGGYGAATLPSGLISPRLARLSGEASESEARAVSLIDEVNGAYAARAEDAATRASIGSGAVILLLFGAFAYFYFRSFRTALANRRILARTREESLTDALTGLKNRRALINDLEAGVAEAIGLESEPGEARGDDQLMLALFDLDGFKQYNDTCGHPAGDALLRRLGKRLMSAVEGRATAYRMGGDEFCLLARVGPDAADELAELGVTALSEQGKGFKIGCSHGVALVTDEASDAEGALSLADGRMYAQKTELASAGRQSSDVLLRLLTERNATLGDHLNDVAALAEPTARRLGLSELEARRIHMAAELHDVGKTGIPDSILEKAGPLDEQEWELMKNHTLIGERILRAASSLAPGAAFVRSHHERIDGDGYPDGLAGESIPMGARIIFACDAFDAMISERPYRRAVAASEALAELRRCAGTQFDSRVVEAIAYVVEGDGAARNGAAAMNGAAARTENAKVAV